MKKSKIKIDQLMKELEKERAARQASIEAYKDCGKDTSCPAVIRDMAQIKLCETIMDYLIEYRNNKRG